MKSLVVTLFVGVLLLFAGASYGQTYTMDWGTSIIPGWVDGATSGTAPDVDGSGVQFSVNIVSSSPQFIPAINGAAESPTVTGTTYIVGGSTENLHVAIDWPSNTDYIEVTYTFSSPVGNLRFNIADIDKLSPTSTSFVDEVTVFGNGGSALPTISRYNNTDADFLAISGNTVTANPVSGESGNSASNSVDHRGTAVVDFGTTHLSSVTVRYTNHSSTNANPGVQAISLGNIQFDIPPVTEDVMNTSLRNDLGQVDIEDVAATDDGSIASYTIQSVPSAGGTLYYFNGSAYIPANPGLILTPAQMNSLRFDPAAGYDGYALFTFYATDNTGLNSTPTSNMATFIIPVSPHIHVPVKLIDFSVVRKGSSAIVGWQTADEIGVDRYIVQRSVDGEEYTDRLSAAPKFEASNAYVINDPLSQPRVPVYYYRLKMLDENGTIQYSAVKLIKEEEGIAEKFSIAPNPCVGGIVNLFCVLDLGGLGSLTITDPAGRVVVQQKQNFTSRENQLRLILPSSSKGVYFLRLSIRDKLYVQKFVVRP